MFSITILELSIELSSSLIEVHIHCTKLLSKVCAKQCLEVFVYVCDEAHIIKFACVILVHWDVILIVCKMTHEQLVSNVQKSMKNM